MLQQFLSYLQHQKAYSPNTIIAYRRDLIEYQNFLEQEFEMELQEAKSDQLRSFVVWLVQERGMQASTLARKLASIRSFYKFSLRKGWVKINPALRIQLPKKAEKLPVVVRQADLIELLDSDLFPEGWEGHRDRLILDVFYRTGMRRAELIGLKWNDISESDSSLRVIGKRMKERKIPLSHQLLEKLLEFKELNTDVGQMPSHFVFTNNKGQKMSPALVYKVVNHYLGLTHSSKNSPHVLRHSFATHMLDNGADLNAIKELLGHANLAATQVYTHNSLEKVKSVYNQAHPKSRKK